MATATHILTLPFRLACSFRSSFVKNAPRFARRSVKRFPDNVEICTYCVWLIKELVKGGMIEKVRDDEGIFATSMVYGRYFSLESLRDSAEEVEGILLEGLDIRDIENQKLLRDKNQGRACGGGSCDDDLVLKILQEYPLFENERMLRRKREAAEEEEKRGEERKGAGEDEFEEEKVA